jgi:hypothetical protein
MWLKYIPVRGFWNHIRLCGATGPTRRFSAPAALPAAAPAAGSTIVTTPTLTCYGASTITGAEITLTTTASACRQVIRRVVEPILKRLAQNGNYYIAEKLAYLPQILGFIR